MMAKPVEPPPIACTLGAGDLQTRVALIAELNRTALRGHHRDDLRLELNYAPEAARRVRDLVQREQSCCAFLTFAVHEEAGRLRVTISAPETAREAVETIFQTFQSLGA